MCIINGTGAIGADGVAISPGFESWYGDLYGTCPTAVKQGHCRTSQHVLDAQETLHQLVVGFAIFAAELDHTVALGKRTDPLSLAG